MTHLLNEQRLEVILEEQQLDGLIATGVENVAYVSGYCCPVFWHVRETTLFALAGGRTGRPFRGVVVPVSQLSHYMEAGTDGLEVRLYGRFPTYAAPSVPAFEQSLLAAMQVDGFPGAVDALVSLLAAAGLSKGRLGLDTTGLDHGAYGRISASLPGVELVPATPVFRQVRAVKTAEELRRLREAARIASTALRRSAVDAREGMTEKALARLYERYVVEEGGKTTFVCVGFGERGAYSNVTPSDRRLARGDLIRYDVGCAYEYYQCDIARTYAFGRVSPAWHRRYEAVVAGERRAIEAAVSRATARDVFTAGVEGVKSAGIPNYARTHCGHAIGLEVYEHPLLSADNPTELEPGMVLAIETPFYELGVGGFQPEDIVLVTERGPEALTRPEQELVVL
jgi:Xaa-Pro aminopeptidase